MRLLLHFCREVLAGWFVCLQPVKIKPSEIKSGNDRTGVFVLYLNQTNVSQLRYDQQHSGESLT